LSKRVTKILGYITIIVVFLQLSGFDLAIVQLNAWGIMIKERQSQGTIEAVISTVSGEAPCERCLAVTKEKKKRDQDQRLAQCSMDKLKFPLPSQNTNALAQDSPYKAPSFIYLSNAFSKIYLEVLSPPPQLSVA